MKAPGKSRTPHKSAPAVNPAPEATATAPEPAANATSTTAEPAATVRTTTHSATPATAPLRKGGRCKQKDHNTKDRTPC